MVTNSPRFSINIMSDKIYFRVNPLYTKHVLKSVELFFLRNLVGLTDLSTPFKTCFVYSGVSSDPSLLVKLFSYS